MAWSYKTNIRLLTLGVLFSSALSAQAMNNDNRQYCQQAGGVVEEMTAQIVTGRGIEEGLKRPFCNFHGHNYFVSIGLDAFASVRPNIAATYMKTLGPIELGSPLFKGPYANPSQNVCKNLGGASIGFIASGGFANDLGQSDTCVFGDGSMVSGWSLIYMTNHRDGYDAIKEQVRSEPLAISVL